MQRYRLEQFIEDPEPYGSAERFLQLAIEAIMDMSNHLIAELELGVVKSCRDIPALLAAGGHRPHDPEEKWDRMTGNRPQ